MRLTKHQKNILRMLSFGGRISHWWQESYEDISLTDNEDNFYAIRIDTFRKLRDAGLIERTKSPHDSCDFFELSNSGRCLL
jgi:uncharacterized protein YjhX (UPF0386 family)